MINRVRRSLCLAASACAAGVGAQGWSAPNLVHISERLVTSGQPDANALSALGGLGFEAVIYLAPSTVADAVREEPALLAAQGIEFVHIPVPFNAPRESHLLALADALDRLQNRKVLVHCQRNLRASSLVFLYRVIRLREDAEWAYGDVAAVWSPSGPWRRLLVEQLAKHRIHFVPY